MRFRKKPVVIEAERFSLGDHPLPFRDDAVCQYTPELGWHIHTLEGPLHLSDGDWIIRGVAGEFYPCKPDVFEQTYQPTESATTAEEDARPRKLWVDVAGSPYVKRK
jgi:hypothetical protein